MSTLSHLAPGSGESGLPNGEPGPESACRCGLDAVPSRPQPAAPEERRVRLTRLRVGQTGRICGGRLDDDDRDMLRALGLRPEARIRLSRTGEPCIVQVLGPHGCSCRIGLARPLAERVIVSVDRDDAGH